MISKKDYLTHLNYGVKTCPSIYDEFKELIDNYFKLLDDYDKLEKTSYSLEGQLYEIYYPNPYKFEDLKEGMWVWDVKYKSYLKIIGFDKIKGLDLSIYVSSGVGIYKHDFYIEFKENRFYPIAKAMEVK